MINRNFNLQTSLTRDDNEQENANLDYSQNLPVVESSRANSGIIPKTMAYVHEANAPDWD